ncbi:MAG: 50S ribosome-binding GTPase [Propionibacteriaceae bacterium]|jgi:GTP-binding protein EngB required for normal cell division|nr:50S ribosome-binding GTPase [Propionibacteriaceae bacterium]
MADLKGDLVWLGAAVEAVRGRITPAVLDEASQVVRRVDERIALGQDITVVAIAGPTGAGKSTLFDSLTGTTMAATGVRRPMTDKAMALSYGARDVSELLDWLGIERRHVATDPLLDGLVLIDLVDYDSVVTDHREEVERLTAVVDEFIWVVDPQKYADASLHDQHLQRLVDQQGAMTFVLNQIDRLSPGQIASVSADFRRILQLDGLANPTVMPVSALAGTGINHLRTHLAVMVAARRSLGQRWSADIAHQAKTLQQELGSDSVACLDQSNLNGLTQACLEAVEADQLVDDVAQHVRFTGQAETGWPLLSWISRLKAHPLRRVWNRLRGQGEQPNPTLVRSSFTIHPADRAHLDTVVRSIARQAGQVLPKRWQLVVARLTTEQLGRLPDQLDQAVMATDLGWNRRRRWWAVVRVIQWLLVILGGASLAWLAANAVATGLLAIDELPMPHWGMIPVPTGLLVAAVVLGLLLAGVCRLLVGWSSKRAGITADQRLHQAIAAVANNTIITPINSELRRHFEAQSALGHILPG